MVNKGRGISGVKDPAGALKKFLSLSLSIS